MWIKLIFLNSQRDEVLVCGSCLCGCTCFTEMCFFLRTLRLKTLRAPHTESGRLWAALLSRWSFYKNDSPSPHLLCPQCEWLPVLSRVSSNFLSQRVLMKHGICSVAHSKSTAFIISSCAEKMSQQASGNVLFRGLWDCLQGLWILLQTFCRNLLALVV